MNIEKGCPAALSEKIAVHRHEGIGSGCRLCGASLRHTFVDLGMSPLANSYLGPDQLLQMEPFYPLHAYVCDCCFLVQLEEWMSPERLFSEYAYFSSYSNSWLNHAESYAEMVVKRFALGQQSRVIEIASNDGYMLQYFLARGMPVLGIEPARNVAEAAVDKGIATETRFFTANMARELADADRQADLLIGNNVLAHVPNLADFVNGLRIVLKSSGVITMEFPHLMRLMQENQFDTIYHEHLSYFSLMTVDRVFAEHRLRIFDVEELPTHGGSLRIYACHADDRSKGITSNVQELIDAEKAAGLTSLDRYVAFGERVAETKWKLLSFLIRAKERGKSIVGYGAPAKGNTLLNYCGIRTDFIHYTVDRSPYKQGRFLPGSHVPIYAPEKILMTRPDYVLILPWNLQKEVVQQMGFIHEWGGRFVVPIPELTVLL